MNVGGNGAPWDFRAWGSPRKVTDRQWAGGETREEAGAAGGAAGYGVERSYRGCGLVAERVLSMFLACVRPWV